MSINYSNLLKEVELYNNNLSDKEKYTMGALSIIKEASYCPNNCIIKFYYNDYSYRIEFKYLEMLEEYCFLCGSKVHFNDWKFKELSVKKSIAITIIKDILNPKI